MTAPGTTGGHVPPLGFIGWGPESAALLKLLLARDPTVIQRATLLGGDAGNTPLTHAIPSAEGLLGTADVIFAEGGAKAIDPYLQAIRLAISDRHVLVLLGGGWSMEALLNQLTERKIARMMVLPSAPGGRGHIAFHAAPYFSEAESAAFRELFAHLDVFAELREEDHFEMLRGLADFAPAAFYTMLESMADGLVMLGIPRTTALEYLVALLEGAARQLAEPGATPARLREGALSAEVAAAGIIELESAGLRGTMMRAIQAAVRRELSRKPQPAQRRNINESETD